MRGEIYVPFHISQGPRTTVRLNKCMLPWKPNSSLASSTVTKRLLVLFWVTSYLEKKEMMFAVRECLIIKTSRIEHAG